MTKIRLSPIERELIIEAVYEDLRPLPNLAHIPDDALFRIVTHMITEHPDRYLFLKADKGMGNEPGLHH